MAEWLAESISAIATVGICLIAFCQLKGLRDSITLQVVFDMERELHERKKLLDFISSEIQERSLKKDTSEEEIEILERKFSTSEENYLNVVERLAFLILKKYLQKKWETEYKGLVVGIVNDNPNKFNIATPYTNIVKLYEKWKDT